MLPRLAKLTGELETFFAAAWRGIRAFITVMRAHPGVVPHSSAGISKGAGLPFSYGRTRLTVLPMDPYAVLAYWEVLPAELAEAGRRASENKSEPQAVLRFHDFALNAVSAKGSFRTFDIEVQLGARNWYIPLWSAGHTYNVELGLKTRSGKFTSLVRANRIQTPRAWPEAKVDEHFMRVSGESRRAEMILTPEYQKPAYVKPAAPVSEALPADTRVSARTMERIDIFEKYGVVVRFPESHAPLQVPVQEEKGVRLEDLAQRAEQSFSPGISSILSHPTRTIPT